MHTLLLLPTTIGVGLKATAQGLLYALDRQGVNATYYQPITYHDTTEPHSYSLEAVEKMIHLNQMDRLLDTVLTGHGQRSTDSNIVIIQGIHVEANYPLARAINAEIARAVNASIIFVATPTSPRPEDLIEQIESAAHNYRSQYQLEHYAGVIINKLNPPFDKKGQLQVDINNDQINDDGTLFLNAFKDQYQALAKKLPLIGIIPWKKELLFLRISDIARHLEAEIINVGDIEKRRAARIILCARSVSNVLSLLQPDSLIITPDDRSDIIIAVCLAAVSGIRIAGLLLTGNNGLSPEIHQLCQQAFASGLPVLANKQDTFRTIMLLKNLYLNIPDDDQERLEEAKEFIADHIDRQWMKALPTKTNDHFCSPAAFRYQLIQSASRCLKTIVLPEGEEPRIIQAAVTCAQRGIARFQLLGKPQEIERIADNIGVTLDKKITLIDPATIHHHYVPALVKLRQHKGVIEPVAREYLKSNVMLGMMMLQQGDVDALVAGAINTTANTVRPALQLIKTAPNKKLVSSVFFMCMANHVLVFGDCAINPTPDAEQLAEIAIQSAETAKQFNIEPMIAMISYSTGNSGSGADVEKVEQAVKRVKALQPELKIDGPLQYDAALIETVAHKKAPQSCVAGHANVLIFPDLNTGNTTYKAVQRSADILSIGPILQGLNKPVNDLSRGATVEDIIYTIAITAVQAQMNNNTP